MFNSKYKELYDMINKIRNYIYFKTDREHNHLFERIMVKVNDEKPTGIISYNISGDYATVERHKLNENGKKYIDDSGEIPTETITGKLQSTSYSYHDGTYTLYITTQDMPLNERK